MFKKIETDVVGFENFLQANKDKIDPELLAAKMCGRWRNAVPLVLSPDTDSPAGGISPEQMNDFEYVNADGSGDPKGIRYPMAHTSGASIHEVSQFRARACPAAAIILTGLCVAFCFTGPPMIRSTVRWHRARDCRLFHQREHRKSIRVRAASVGQ